MNILINTSSCKAGGGIQVADSICRHVNTCPRQMFHIVLSERLNYMHDVIDKYPNVRTYDYTKTNSLSGLISGRDKFLDAIVANNNIDAVYIIFGPSTWRPNVPTICGFAMAHLVLDDSPYWGICSLKDLVLTKFRNYIQKWNFGILSDSYFTENEYISDKVRKLYPNKKVVTITNNCHQIFDEPDKWKRDIQFSPFEGLTLLTICANYPHKNLRIIPMVLEELSRNYPDVNVRFALSINPDDLGELKDNVQSRIIFLGRVNIEQCPYLYEQSDVMFLPTMLECFSASYAEAMKMGKVIMTSDLGFARSLCGDAAIYFDTTSAKDIADKIATLAHSPEMKQPLIESGYKQISNFNTPKERFAKIMELIESQVNTK